MAISWGLDTGHRSGQLVFIATTVGSVSYCPPKVLRFDEKRQLVRY